MQPQYYSHAKTSDGMARETLVRRRPSDAAQAELSEGEHAQRCVRASLST